MSGEQQVKIDNPEKEISGKQAPDGPAVSNTQTGVYYNPEKEIEKLREQSKDDISKINLYLFGLIAFVTITFILQIYVTNLDRIRDKDLYLKYIDLYQKYFDESAKMKDEINSQKIDFNNLKSNFQSLKDKNYYLK